MSKELEKAKIVVRKLKNVNERNELGKSIGIVLQALENSIPKEVIEKKINKLDLCIELQKIVNNGQNDNNPEKYYFSKRILQELLEGEK